MSLRRAFKAASIVLRKHAPEIMVTTGVIGSVIGTVMACKATTKAEEILDRHAEEMEQIHQAQEIADEGEYTEEEIKRDTVGVYGRTAVGFAKLYAPTAAVETASIALILGGFHIIKSRYAALGVAYNALTLAFKQYRSRVINELGTDKDREFRFGTHKELVEKIEKAEDGTEIVTQEEVDVVNTPDDYSVYAKIFDASNPNFEKDPETNRWFLKKKEEWLNIRLQKQGYLFLNEAYAELGFEPTKAGQLAGWIYDPENPIGDNRVDLGIFNTSRSANARFVNGYEPVIILDFNVDGNLLTDGRLKFSNH